MRSSSAGAWTSLDAGTLLGFLNVAMWMALALRGGVGAQDTTWSLVALAATALLALALALAGRELIVASRAVAVAAAALAGFVALNFLSILWAAAPADALSAAEQTALAAASFAMLALWPRASSRIPLVLGSWSLAVAATALGLTLALVVGDDPGRFFDPDGRLDSPIGYPNAVAALWTMAALPCLVLAARRATGLLLRAVALGSAALLLQVAVLSQSRGWTIALPAAVFLLFLAARNRLRLLAVVSVAALAVGATLPWTLRPLAALAEERSDADDLIRAAAVALLLSALAAALAAALWALADRRIELSPRVTRGIGIVLLLGVLIVGAGGVAALAARHAEAGDWISERWDELKKPDYPDASEESRFGGGFGSHRGEEWSIAWDEFRAHPLVGVGADNYHAAWMLHRSDGTKAVRYPHSLPLRMLSELGVIGSALFLGFLVAVAAAVLRLRRTDDWDLRLAATLPAVYWLVHGTIDWFWELPSLTAPALGLLGLSIAARAPAPTAGRVSASVRRVAVAATCAVVLVTATSWLAFTYEQAGAASWRDDPQSAYADLGRSASLSPLAARPLLVRGSIALRLGDLDRAQADFEEAQRREPKSWYALFELGLIASERGEAGRARALIERARGLNPRERVIELALRRLNLGLRLDSSSLNRRFTDPSNGGR